MNPTVKLSWRNTWTIRRRLALGFGSTIALLVVASVVGLALSRGTQTATRSRLSEALDVRQNLAASDGATRDFVILAENDLLGGDRTYRVRMDSLFAAADSLRRLLVSGSALSNWERTRVDRIGALQSRIAVRLAMARAATDVGLPAEAVRQSRLSESLLDSLFSESRGVAAERAKRTTNELASIDQAASRQQWFLVASALVGIVLASIFGVLTWRAVVRPLQRLAASARRMGEGDFRVSVNPEGLDAEYRALAEAFVQTTTRLGALLGQIQAQANQVAGAATRLANSSGEAAGATKQISATIESIASAAEEQIHLLNTSRNVLARVGESADRLSSTAAVSSRIGAQINDAAIGARGEIGQALDTLHRARDVISASANGVTRLDAASKSIATFVSAIQDVADMTNLLALNAAIEAARAGDHGRGFAVVAQEVRDLSASSAKSALQARDIVEAMQRDVAMATSAFTDGVSALGDVDGVSRTASDALARIETAVTGLGDVATTLAGAATANRSAVEELVRHVDATAGGAEDQAAASEEAAAGAQQSAASTEEVVATAAQLLDNAARLNELVAGFSV
jgi:methyl-accepting chemotaxis protein